ncbi:MAG: SDR family oxidoreductase [Alphaproteobacteria bacterium]|nr:SDR family oxidoreductase [Alphaproteobacteria bacterium]
MLDIFSLKGRVALVTGSSQGLGWAMAEALAEAGAHVVLNARNAAKCEEKRVELTTRGLGASVEAFDVTDLAAIEAAVAAIDRRHGRLDILVNNAGIVTRNPLHEITEEQWSSVVDTDLTACFRLARAASKPMVRECWGRIINISSVMGAIARPSIAPYVASKAGVHGLTRALAVELGGKGVTVNCIGPGFYPGAQNEVVRRDKKFYDWVAGRAPLGRWGDPQELAGAVIYFASPASSFCTGQVLMVDGGMTIAL